MQIACFKCQHAWSFEPPLSRNDVCPKCRQDARACRNCRFYDTSSFRSCRESQAEWVKDKEKSNFCGYFEPLDKQKANDDLSKAKSKLESLFGPKK